MNAKNKQVHIRQLQQLSTVCTFNAHLTGSCTFFCELWFKNSTLYHSEVCTKKVLQQLAF